MCCSVRKYCTVPRNPVALCTRDMHALPSALGIPTPWHVSRSGMASQGSGPRRFLGNLVCWSGPVWTLEWRCSGGVGVLLCLVGSYCMVTCVWHFALSSLFLPSGSIEMTDRLCLSFPPLAQLLAAVPTLLHPTPDAVPKGFRRPWLAEIAPAKDYSSVTIPYIQCATDGSAVQRILPGLLTFVMPLPAACLP
jgi:hypothetical protein